MQADNSAISSMHYHYRTLTGMDVGLDYWRERCWHEWLAKGFRKDDLATVVAHIKKGIRENKRQMGALKFSNLIGNLDYFEEDLAVARAEKRNAVKTDERQEVMKATGREDRKDGDTSRTVGDVIKGATAFEEFRRLKELL